MAWTASIIRVSDNPVPNDTVFVTIAFTDGARSFERGYQLVAGGLTAAQLMQDKLAEVAAFYAALPETVALTISGVPQRVTMFQARAALLGAGLLDQVDAALKSQGGLAAIAWEYSTTVERRSPLVTAMAGLLGLSDPQLDAMFMQASDISA